MSAARKLLIIGGLAVALVGMAYGLFYAVFVEHQTLDAIGGSLTMAFTHGANGDVAAATRSIDDYGRAAYVYVRQVDAHSHWIGLAMLLVVLGIAFDRVGLGEGTRITLAAALVAGAVAFPLGVLMQTWMTGAVPKAVAIIGPGLIILGLGGTALGFARGR